MRLAALDVRGAVEETVVLAPRLEELGYERYWIAEHPPQPSPILIASIVAGLTQQIRVGTAGILFHYYAPLRTAHDFQFLERAYEGRVDAGFCGAIDPRLPEAELEGLALDQRIARYDERVARFVRHLRNTPGDPAFDAGTAWAGALDEPPEAWSLGGGARSADLAAKHGLCFGYALLYGTSIDDAAVVARYRERFVASRTQPRPRVALAVCGVCSDTRAEALARADELRGGFFTPRIVGTGPECAEQLRALRQRYAFDDLVFADLCRDLDERTRCYERLMHAVQAM